MISLSQALSQVLAGAEPLATENIAVKNAHGRVLAEDVKALRTQPPTDVSAMDGYAAMAGQLTYTVVGESAAGHPYPHSIAPHEAVRIFTGATLPLGANSIVMQEHVTREGETITLESPAILGKHIRKMGLDFTAGAVAITKNTLITPQIVGLLAALNHAQVPVTCQPLVAILSTGDELVEAGEAVGENHIVSTNALVIKALSECEGAIVQDYGISPDNLEQLTAKIREILATKPDVFITSGGASVGDHDLVQRVLKSLGMDLGFWKIAMRPGKPLIHGRMGETHILGLPGNPVSSFVCAKIFLVPLIRKLQGKNHDAPLTRGVITHALKANDERAEYMRGRAWQVGGAWQCEVFSNQDSSLLSVLAKSNALIFREVRAEALSAGDAVEFMVLN